VEGATAGRRTCDQIHTLRSRASDHYIRKATRIKDTSA
jgi:hypothetical protein